MAPSRRKGASKAAVAAAARRQWKVGDLVLAKVKGFPAWPATVSEPEKWGYPADWKKVLVYFFGTQQIAFCNPADVEAFTEEKKESLLSKRHGKGADFVRAVREIIDSYELKKQEQVCSAHTNGQVSVTNGDQSECAASSGSKEEAPTVSIDPCSKVSDSSKANDDKGNSGEGAAATTHSVLHSRDMASEEPSRNLVITRAPVATTYSRKRYSGTQSSVMQSAPSGRRSRNSARLESLLPDSVGKINGKISSLVRDVSLRRTKRIRKSPDLSDGQDNSSPLVSNGSPEENGSEIVTADSDGQSFNEGISVQSGHKHMESEVVGESFRKDVKSNERLEFQIRAVIVKKKRKPSRKRAITSTTEFPDRLDKQPIASIEIDKSDPALTSGIEKSNGRDSKEDGDEHLPLVKRARVRMGRTSSSLEESDAVMDIAKPPEVSNSVPGQNCIDLSDREDPPEEGNILVRTGEIDLSSSLGKCTVSKPPLWEVKKHTQYACLVDGESALPPSKRLHRALEAMSANAAEGKQVSPERPSSMKTIINGSLSPSMESSHVAVESKERDEAQQLDNNSGFQACTSLSSLAPAVEQNNTSDEIATCNQPVGSVSCPEPVSKEMVVKSADSADGKEFGFSCNNTVETVVLQSPKPLTDAIGGNEALTECNNVSVVSMLSLNNECEVETSELIEACKRDPSDVSWASSDPQSSNMENGTLSRMDVNVHQQSSLGKSYDVPEHPIGEGKDDHAMSKDVKEITCSNVEITASPSPMTVEVLNTAPPGTEISHSTPISEECLSHKTVSGTRTSSSPTDRLDSTARASPPNTSNNSNILENNGCCSPGAHSHHEKPKQSSKWSSASEANAALTSFEASLGTLTRTKKSIDKATRIAIECAKFGTAVKALEIIARSLESEPSLHKRVDLFFLVDSIAQCSRGLKGDVGSLYPSAIQAVLPRLLLAAAPPGSNAVENRRQCLKVLKLWQERKILPEPMIRHHIRELDSLNNMSSRISNSRRPFRNERAFDDPVREVEGMLMDEYGSNSSAGFWMPTMLNDGIEGSNSDGEGFEAVTSEHNNETSEERDKILTPAIEKHTHILEDVDGELEMEDVSPSCEGRANASSNAASGDALRTSHHHLVQRLPSFAPPLPKDLPPSSPPLPKSPPPPPLPSLPLPPPPPPSLIPPPPPPRLPPPPPLPSLPPPPPVSLPDAMSNHPDPKLYVGIQSGSENSQQMVSQPVNYHPPELRDPHVDVAVLESSNSCSFSSLPLPRPPVQAPNNLPLRPPHSAPSSQFSYFQADQSRREIPPPSYPGRFHFVNSTDSGNFHSDHDRMPVAPHDQSWRFPPPPFNADYAPMAGPCRADSPRVPYPPHQNTYAGPPCEPPMSNNPWSYPPQPASHREMASHRPFPEPPGPVPMRGSNYWRPR